MEDSAFVDRGRTGSDGDFVIRTFSPVRIERLLLTRLFDLMTGPVVAGSGKGMGTRGVLKTAATDVGKEAA
jgi:hypothetical protein